VSWSGPWPSGWEVRHVAETGSTNTDLLAALAAGTAGDRSVLAASHQTAGRGRLDRRWDAPSGTNLLVSVVFAPVPRVPAEATQRLALAARAAASAVCPGATVTLKWPNDLLLDSRKVGGILAQRSTDVDAVVVGLGLNVRWAPAGAAALGASSPPDVLRLVLDRLDALPADVSGAYRDALATIGQQVRVELPGGREVVGVAVDVDREGRLVITDDAGGTTVHDVGDVVHLRPDE
jgi:BirA family transcriptional regulator, biotin operon repressor / biotin---[acetyl-CoA-carboxylase] ligase